MKASLRLPIYTTSFAAISGVVQTENGTCAGTKPHPQSPNPSSVQQSEYDNQDAVQFLKCSSFMEPTAKDLRSTFCLILLTLDIASRFLRILGFQAWRERQSPASCVRFFHSPKRKTAIGNQKTEPCLRTLYRSTGTCPGPGSTGRPVESCRAWYSLPQSMVRRLKIAPDRPCPSTSEAKTKVRKKTDVISDHQSDTTTQILLWKQLFNQEDLYQRLFKILQILGILLVIYISYTLIDFVRHGLFSVTVNRSRGHWFELVWTKMPHKVQAFRSVHTSDLIE